MLPALSWGQGCSEALNRGGWWESESALTQVIGSQSASESSRYVRVWVASVKSSRSRLVCFAGVTAHVTEGDSVTSWVTGRWPGCKREYLMVRTGTEHDEDSVTSGLVTVMLAVSDTQCCFPMVVALGTAA